MATEGLMAANASAGACAKCPPHNAVACGFGFERADFFVRREDMKKRIAQFCFAAIICFAGSALAQSQVMKNSYRWHPVTMDAPTSELSVSKGLTSLQAYKGQNVLMNFWATWCTPCMAELPALDALARRYPDLTVLTVATDNAPYAELHDLLFTKLKLRHVQMVHDHSGALMEALGRGGMPITYMMNAEGRLTHWYMGATDWNSNEQTQFLEKALSIKAQSAVRRK